MSKIYRLKTVQQIPVALDEAWDFFSDPSNLSKITPSGMGFKILSEKTGQRMYAGQIIEYKVKPVLGIPVYWMTEITHVEEGKFFVDEQRFGPYSFWHHQHHFKENEHGVEMTDLVHYKIPFGFLGDLTQALFVGKQLESIFEFRKKAVDQIFGGVSGGK
jgi:ligand-binding SRPBCC domain-containing protein